MRAAFVAALAAGVLGLAACGPAQDSAVQSTTSAIKIGGPFQLIDTEGRPVTEQALKGKPTAIFFGFTYCPEVCPTTMAELTNWLRALGRHADQLNVVFISVDPERDTPAQLKTYLSNFDPRIRGFTGSPEAVAAAAKAYRVYYRKVDTDDGGYTVDHSAAIYLFDKDGGFVEPIGYGTPPERAVGQLRKLVR
ncbi:SCO family protein [Phenylobacterium sp.]|uniref:SCO family protein n=1 Tax=Phenylobacterium sp. TaxID=1871053 RepID=UPI0027343257|nr:SCO family protein [Phenylobacterium sp.]MDP3854909.1 SCO family protein [Phenylobacterium sp.]